MTKKLSDFQQYLDKYKAYGKTGLVVMPDDKLVLFSDLDELLTLTNAFELFNKTAEDKFEYSTTENKPIFGFVTKEGKLKLSVKRIKK